jgi:hypothetical protein
MVNKMATKEEIIKEAEYYLNNDVTIEQASTNLHISKRTLQLHLKKLEELAPETFKLVQEKKTGNIKAGTIKGGQTGKRGPTWTEEQALEVAMKIINEGMTYREAEAYFKIPSSTLHEMVTKGVKDFDTASMIYAVAEANRRGMSAQEYMEEHRKLHPISEDIAKEIMEEKIAKSGKK